jgi:DNA-3-methyladenine glycosylase
MYNQKILPKRFYKRDPEIVAKELLGKKLIRKIGSFILEGVIVETEAYYGLNDPASRAFLGKKKYNIPMWQEPGRTFIYNVHKYWMFNVIAHEPTKVGAVLVRAIEPTAGISIMKRNRSVKNLVNLTNGPGKLTLALKIDRSLNGLPVTSKGSYIIIAEGSTTPKKVKSSSRIGVKKDLERHLRFYIGDNKFISRKQKM